MVDEVTPGQAYAALVSEPDSVLVDVRTEAEWLQIGVPLLESAGKQPVFISWQFATGAINPNFLGELDSAGVAHDKAVYFICRSGVRSMAAAMAAEAAGFQRCFNVAEGFEGRPGAGRLYGPTGWKADGLPWRQLPQG